MIYFNLVTSINLLESNTRTPQYRWLAPAMWLSAALVTGVYAFLPELYGIFLATYSGLVVILILLSFKRVYCQNFPMLDGQITDEDGEIAKKALRRCRLLLWSAFFFYGWGSIMWGTENALCPPSRGAYVDPEMVKSLNRIQYTFHSPLCFSCGHVLIDDVICFVVDCMHGGTSLLVLVLIYGFGSISHFMHPMVYAYYQV